MIVTPNRDAWDFEIDQMPLNQAFPETHAPDNPMMALFQQFDDKKVVLTKDHQKLFGTFNKKQRIMHHSDFVDSLDKACTKLFGEVSTQVIPIVDGSTIKVVIDLPEENLIDMGKGDVSHIKILGHNSYRNTSDFKLNIGLFRLVCENGAVAGDSVGSIKGNSLFKIFDQDFLDNSVQKLVDDASQLRSIWLSWLDEEVPWTVANTLFTKMLSKKAAFSLLHGGSEWPKNKYELWNDLTAISTHETTSLSSQKLLDSTIQRLFYNAKSPLSTESLKLAHADFDAWHNVMFQQNKKSNIFDKVKEAIEDDLTGNEPDVDTIKHN